MPRSNREIAIDDVRLYIEKAVRYLAKIRLDQIQAIGSALSEQDQNEIVNASTTLDGIREKLEDALEAETEEDKS